MRMHLKLSPPLKMCILITVIAVIILLNTINFPSTREITSSPVTSDTALAWDYPNHPRYEELTELFRKFTDDAFAKSKAKSLSIYETDTTFRIVTLILVVPSHLQTTLPWQQRKALLRVADSLKYEFRNQVTAKPAECPILNIWFNDTVRHWDHNFKYHLSTDKDSLSYYYLPRYSGTPQVENL
ncbi:MAG: hypothetical protein P0Y53_01320 [Candidatus Pseudobacter hemicellulosilyticus]|uniref:Uncharacterized protein n=1 Tax=Candidatus Pseudobacter hemicellulosilyticus TaxID=3121375 RepID=A0AAJ6BHC2_9BACT|nr:MAG: hypothetical protein P0Y53_01320 [Pseudobacter sp.]